MNPIKPTLLLFALCISLCAYSQNITQDTIQARSALIIADSLSGQAQYDTAISYYKKASKLYETHQLWNHYLKAENFWSIALRKKGQYDSAIKKLEKAVQIAKQYDLDQSPEVADSYNNIGGVYYYLGKYQQALEYFEKGLKIRLVHFGGQHPDVARSYHNIGTMYKNLGKYQQALENHEKSLEIRIKHYGKQHPDVTGAYNGIGNIYLDLGKYDQALEYFEKALKIYLSHYGDQHLKTAKIYNNISNIYNRIGKYNQALILNHKALKIYLEQYGEQHFKVALSYVNIGVVYDNLGKYDQALEYFEKALKIRIAHFGRQHMDVAGAYHNVGLGYDQLGKYHRALEHYKKAIKIYMGEDGEYPLGIAESYNNIGYIYNNLGDCHQALEHHEKALKIYLSRLGEYHPDVASSYNNIGETYIDLGNYQRALEKIEKGLKIKIKIHGDRHPEVAASYKNIGRVYVDLGKYRQALENYNKALEIYKTYFGEHHPNVAFSYNNIGKVYANLGMHDQALQYYQKALYSNDKSTNADSFTSQPKLTNYLEANYLLQSLSEKGKMLQLLSSDNTSINKPLELSLNTYQVADTLIQQIRRNTWNEKDKLELVKKSTEIYREAMATALRLYQKQQERYYLSIAFYFSEQNRASILLSSQTQKEALTFGNVPDSLVALEKDLKLDKSFYTKQLQLQKDSAIVAYNENQFFIVNRRLDSLTQFMETSYPDYYQMKYSPKIISLNDVQKRLAEDELMLHYLWGDDILYGFSISKDDAAIQRILLDSVLLKAPETLMAHFKEWGISKSSKRLSSTSELIPYQTAAYNVYQKLVAPLLTTATAQTKKLIIIPDGPLSQIPFEVLTTQAPNTEYQSFQSLAYLLKDYAIRFGYSASLTFEATQQHTNEESLITFGGFAPSYENDNIYPQRKKDSLENAIVQNTLRNLYDRNVILHPLIYNLSEVETINDAMGGDIFGGEMATVDQFKRMAYKYRILHIAAHGLINDSLPEFSGIAFANNTQLSESKNYNFLQMHEIYNMNINAELVVLSACQTGVGTFKQGEGVMSLGRAFRYAGSPNVMVSQWNVDDAHTSELMEYFYHFLSDGMDKDHALQKAKIQFLDNNDVAHPFLWGSFTLWGNDTPILIAKSYGWYIFVIGVCLLGLLYIGYRLRMRQENIHDIK